VDEPRDAVDGAQLDALIAAALEPGLRTVLCLDAAPAAVMAASETFARLLCEADGNEVRTVVLGSGEAEEDLWDGVAWVRGDDGVLPELVPGPLGPPPAGTTKLVVIPELPRIGLAGVRACVTLLGDQVAHLERYGKSLAWQAGATAWIAGCDREAAGSVSPHLLDRFALRVPFSKESRTERRAWLRAALEAGPDSKPRGEPAVDGAALASLRRAATSTPAMSAGAIDAVLDLVEEPAPGARRQIALARLAVACARMAAAPDVTPSHVEAADAMLRVRAPVARPAPEQPPDPVVEPGDRPVREAGVRTTAAGDPAPAPAVPQPVLAPDASEALEAADIQIADGAATSIYPEDHARVDREPEPLRRPVGARGPVGRTAGVPVGVQPTTQLQDIALTATVVEAIKWQRIRRESKHEPSGAKVPIWPVDLRSYRRAPFAHEMLALVLDYTCRGRWSWPELLLPYLRWGYTHRASVCLVRVGAGDAGCSLKADRLVARNMLDPRIGPVLDAHDGDATPLAHGLELARQTLRHALHHSRAGISGAQLVVVTDGRGNVPLQASFAGRLGRPVRSEGIDDALAVASQIAVLDRVAVTVVDPEPAVWADLPGKLAAALGAGIVPLRSLVVA
jgi:magnesium chelatase subunit D